MLASTAHSRRLILAGAVIALLVPSSRPAAAQAAAQAAPPCDYQRCAFSIVAVASGLRVTRGADETPVATLGFLFTRDISRHFNDAARSEAKAAVRTRRVAMVLTDVGLGLLIAGVADAAGSDNGSGRYVDTRSARLMLAGAATVGISVPLQFKADTHLARAIWRHNAVYAAGTR